MSDALIIMAHGSRAEAANDEFRLLVEKVAERGGDYATVLPCFLELARPSLLEALQQIEHQPVTRVLVYPLFFNIGKHVAEDIPAQVEEARARHPHLHIELLDYFGTAEGLVALMDQHIHSQR